MPAGAAQVVQVLVGGEAAVDDGHDPAEPPARRPSLTSGSTELSLVLPGHTQHRTGIPSLVTASPITIWGRSVRWSLEWPYLRNSSVVFGLEVGGGGVEQQQVDLEVEQVGDGEEHRLLHLGLGVGLDQQVHRPVRLVLIHRLQPGDRDVVR